MPLGLSGREKEEHGNRFFRSADTVAAFYTDRLASRPETGSSRVAVARRGDAVREAVVDYSAVITSVAALNHGQRPALKAEIAAYILIVLQRADLYKVFLFSGIFFEHPVCGDKNKRRVISDFIWVVTCGFLFYEHIDTLGPGWNALRLGFLSNLERYRGLTDQAVIRAMADLARDARATNLVLRR